ncbi:hypothetical protein FRC02_005574 [Tulasnella sp. 418]|nr:hypothetical protein FRC02_005574 [Tulasnella sp. 418]
MFLMKRIAIQTINDNFSSDLVPQKHLRRLKSEVATRTDFSDAKTTFCADHQKKNSCHECLFHTVKRGSSTRGHSSTSPSAEYVFRLIVPIVAYITLVYPTGHPSNTQRSPPSAPSIASNGSNHQYSSAVVNAGNRFKRVLQNRRMKKPSTPDDCDDLAISDAAPHHQPSIHHHVAQSPNPKHSFPSTTRARSPSEAPTRPSIDGPPPLPPPQHPSSTQPSASSSGPTKVSPRQRFASNIQSNFQAFTANIRKHSAQLSFPSQSNQSNSLGSPADDRRPPLPPKSAAVRVYQHDAALAHKPHNAAALIHPGASAAAKNLPAIATHNMATVNTVVPRKVTTIAAKVIGAVDSSKRTSFVGSIGGGGNRNSTITLKDGTTLQMPLGGVPETEHRDSFQIPDSPSISAAIEFMRGSSRSPDGSATAPDAEKKKEKRRSRFLPGGSSSSAPSASFVPPLPLRKEESSKGISLNGDGASGLVPGRRVMDLNPARTNKRRSASLGDVFKGGFTPSTFSSTVITQNGNNTSASSTQWPENVVNNNTAGGVGVFHGSSNFITSQLQHKSALPNHSQATPLGSATSSQPMAEPLKNKMLNLKKRPTHRLSPSADTLMYRGISNPSPLNPAPTSTAQQLAAQYAYVNADVDDSKPSSFLARPQLSPSSSYSGSQKPGGTGGHLVSSGMMVANAVTGGSGGDSSGTESNKGGLKSRLRTGSSSQSGHGGNQSGSVNRRAPPPPSFHLTGDGTTFPTSNPPPMTPSVTGTPDTTTTAFSRARSNSSHTSINGSHQQPPMSATPTPALPSRKLASNAALPQPGPTYGAQNMVGNAAGTIGAAAGAAGGLAIHFGRKGWDRVEKLWTHRSNTPSVSGYNTADENGWLSTAVTEVGGGRTGKKGGVLGTMVRPPVRKSGVVFGRRLEDCVRETRVGVTPYQFGNTTPAMEPSPSIKGQGIWVTALVTRCVEHLTQWGLEEEGLFRISGRASHINKLKSEFDAGADYLLKEVYPGDLDPHAVASVLKTYLRDLPEPILTRNLTTSFDITMSGTGTLSNPGPSLGVTSFGGISNGAFGYSTASLIEHPTAETMIDLKILINRLPKENFDLLHEICKLLRAVDRNQKLTKMPLSNLLLVFCPSLQLSPGFLKIVVEKQDYLFGDGDMGKVAPSTSIESQLEEKETASSSSSDFFRPPATGGLPSGVRLRPSRPHGENYKNNRVTAYPVAMDGSFESLLGSSSCESLSLDGPSPSNNNLPRPLIPTSVSAPMMHDLPSTSSSISSNAYNLRSNQSAVATTSPPPSLRLRHKASQLASSRKSSLSMLFSGGGASRPATPIISGPIPIRSATPSDPPVLDLALPDAPLSMSPGLPAADSPVNMYTDSPALTDPASPQTSLSSAPTSDSEFYRYTITQENVHLAALHLRDLPTQPSKEVLVPRPVATSTSPVPIPHSSPPPRIGIFNSPRSTGDDWAKSVLMAAGGNRA